MRPDAAAPADSPASSTVTGRGGVPRPSRFAQAVFGAVLGGVAVGLLFVSQDFWRRGLFTVGGVLLVAAAARLCLPSRRVGMLAVRGRLFDTITLVVLGGAVIVLTFTVPYTGG